MLRSICTHTSTDDIIAIEYVCACILHIFDRMTQRVCKERCRGYHAHTCCEHTMQPTWYFSNGAIFVYNNYIYIIAKMAIIYIFCTLAVVVWLCRHNMSGLIFHRQIGIQGPCDCYGWRDYQICLIQNEIKRHVYTCIIEQCVNSTLLMPPANCYSIKCNKCTCILLCA